MQEHFFTHPTRPHTTRNHPTRSHATRSHATGSHATRSHASNSHPTHFRSGYAPRNPAHQAHTPRPSPLPDALCANARRGAFPGSCPINAHLEKPAYLPLSRTTERVLGILLEGDLSRLRAESDAEALGIS